jgi:ribosomal protein S18 acetylase RimI-like enzyme
MGPLTTGRLRNNAQGKEENYYVSRLDLSHLDRLVELQKVVLDNMARKDHFTGLSVGEFENVLSDSGVTVGAFVREELIGFYSILFPGYSEDNLGKDIGIPEKYFSDVAHFEAAGVHPDFRGNSLQKIMTGICLEQAMKIKPIKYICVTISPYNYPSLDHMFAFKLYIRDLKVKYGDMLRYICSKNMEERQIIQADSIVEIEISDHSEQLKLLQQGYVGFRLIRSDGKNFIGFGKVQI